MHLVYIKRQEKEGARTKKGGATEHPVSQFETWFVLLNQVIPHFGSAVGWGQIDASGFKLEVASM